MSKNLKIQENYTLHQLVLPLDLGMKIPEDDEVRTYLELRKDMNLEKFTKPDLRVGRKAKDRVKILDAILFGFMIGVRSLRKIEKACKTDIRFMYLLEGIEPSHTTIGEVINYIENIDDLFLEVFKSIETKDKINTDITYIDGTKIEADANRYTFVWKKAVLKHLEKLQTKIKNISMELLLYTKFELKDTYDSNDLIKIVNQLDKQVSTKDFVHGKGKRKSPIQRAYEKVVEYCEKMIEYEIHLKIMGDRNSYSKTDHDATFMRMKTDHMRNGQLKAGYNIQMSVSDEYITLVDVSDHRSDQPTFIPFLKKYKHMHGNYPTYPVADAGYGTYDNYYFCLENDMELVQKFSTWEKEKTRKHIKNPFRLENMKSDDGRYICPNGREVLYKDDYESRYIKAPHKIKRYECVNCEDCQMRANCTKGKSNKQFSVNETLVEMKQTVKENLESKFGIELRTNRSIQVEGAFGVIKEDSKFTRFTRISKKGVHLEYSLIAIGYNLMKYHNKKYRNKQIIH